MADWVAIETRQTRISARADLNLAHALEHHPVLRPALEAGAVNVAQARVIVTALDRLPTSGEFAVDHDQRQAAEAHLVALAADHDAKALAVLGRKLFEVIAPDLAEAYEGQVLADQEAAAARKTMLTLREDADGTCHGRFRIPLLHGQMLGKMILALCSPVRSTGPPPSPPTDSTPAHRGPARAGVVPADRGHPRQVTAQGRRLSAPPSWSP